MYKELFQNQYLFTIYSVFKIHIKKNIFHISNYLNYAISTNSTSTIKLKLEILEVSRISSIHKIISILTISSAIDTVQEYWNKNLIKRLFII